MSQSINKHKLSKYELLKMTLTNTDQLINIQRTDQTLKLLQYEKTLSNKVRRYDKRICFGDLDKNRSNYNQPYQIRYSTQLLNALLRSND